MIYLTRIPSYDQKLDWFRVFSTKKAAMTFAKEQVSLHNEEDYQLTGKPSKLWYVQYLPMHDDDYTFWEGKNAIVVQQMESYYHGA
jgi:hypothetical protein